MPDAGSKNGRIMAALIASGFAGALFLLSVGLVTAAQAFNFILIIVLLCVAVFRISWDPALAVSTILARMTIVSIAALYVQPFLEAETGTDAQLYHAAGLQISHSLLSAGVLSSSGEGWGTNTYAVFTGIWYALCGASQFRIMIFNSLIAGIGLWMVYRTFVEHYGESRWPLKYLVLLDPSVLYWSSTHGKDPSVLFFIGLLFRGLSQMLRAGTIGSLFIYFVALVGIFLIRAQLALLCAFSVLLTLVWLRLRSPLPNRALKLCLGFSVGAIIAIAAVVLVAYGHMEGFSAGEFLPQLSFVIGTQSYGGTALDVPQFTTWAELMAYLPRGMFAVLFRPLPWEAGNTFVHLAAIYQLLLSTAVLLILWCLLGRFRSAHFRHILRPWRFSADPLTFFLLIYVAGFCLLYALISGNLGTLVREKIQLAPLVWCCAFAMFLHPQRAAKNLSTEASMYGLDLAKES